MFSCCLSSSPFRCHQTAQSAKPAGPLCAYEHVFVRVWVREEDYMLIFFIYFWLPVCVWGGGGVFVSVEAGLVLGRQTEFFFFFFFFFFFRLLVGGGGGGNLCQLKQCMSKCACVCVPACQYLCVYFMFVSRCRKSAASSKMLLLVAVWQN